MGIKQAFLSGLSKAGVNKAFRAMHRGQIKTLLYHNVLDNTGAFSNAISPAEFESHLIFLKQHFNPIGIAQNGDFVGLREDRINTLITFDDGFINNYEVVFPLLVKHGLRACFFIIANCLRNGDVPSIAARYAKGSGPGGDYRTLNLAQAREMANAGMTIGSHSLAHADFRKMPFEAGIEDARQARHTLSDMLGLEIGAFAFPWGYEQPGQSAALGGDYRRIFTTRHGFNRPGDAVFLRNEVADKSHLESAAAGSLDFFLPFWRIHSTFWGDTDRDQGGPAPGRTPATDLTPVVRPKILCLIETLGRGGGAEQLLVGLIPAIQKLGYDIEVATLFDWSDNLGADLEAQGVHVHCMNFPFSSRWSILGNLSALRRFAKSGGFKLFWGHLYFGNLYGALLSQSMLDAKYLVTLHSEGYSQAPPRDIKAHIYLSLERTLLGRANAKVAVSGAVAQDYGAFFNWPRVDVIHNGVVLADTPPPLSPDARAALRRRHNAEATDFLVTVPSRLVPKKGHAVLFEAIARLKRDRNWTPRVLAYGNGPLLDTLINQVRRDEIENQVSFLPPVPHDELFGSMQASDLVCMPSLREPFGIAAAEAMALGVPTILTQTDGFLELVGDSASAMMVPVGDPDALAEAIWSLYQNSALRGELATRGKARIEANFDIAICAEKWVALFDRVAAEEA